MRTYAKPELVRYGSVDVAYASPSNSSADCACDCAADLTCDSVGAFTCADGGAGEPCASNCGACSESDPPC